MNKIIFILAMLFSPSLFAATLTTNMVPYVCQGGANPQLCNSNITTDSNGNASAPFIPNNIQIFTSSGTWTKPANVSRVYVKVWGDGGGGGCNVNATSNVYGGGGGSGGYSEGYLSVTGNVNVSVGSGGAAGNSSAGGNGAGSSFAGATIISANGGGGGGAASGSGGSAGSGAFAGSGGQINFVGNAGTPGGNNIQGLGGTTPFYVPYGTGGFGSKSQNGSQGSPGLVIVYY